jgi:hypothetical protein
MFFSCSRKLKPQILCCKIKNRRKLKMRKSFLTKTALILCLLLLSSTIASCKKEETSGVSDEPIVEASSIDVSNTAESQSNEQSKDILVTDAYVNDISYNTEKFDPETGDVETVELTCKYRIPEIKIPNVDMEDLNREIYASLISVITDSVKEIGESGEPLTCSEASYRWYTKGDVLSLVVLRVMYPSTSIVNQYDVYNINITNGSILSKDELLATVGMSEEEFSEKAKEALEKCYWNGWDKSNENFSNSAFVEMFNEGLEKTTSKENIDNAILYIDENGDVCIIAEKHEKYLEQIVECDLNIVDFEKSKYIA